MHKKCDVTCRVVLLLWQELQRRLATEQAQGTEYMTQFVMFENQIEELKKQVSQSTLVNMQVHVLCSSAVILFLDIHVYVVDSWYCFVLVHHL